MSKSYPESAYTLTDRIVWFSRLCSKIRLMKKGLLPEEYHEFYGAGFDGRCCRFLKVSHDDIKKLVLEGKSDEEILSWCYKNGYRPNDEEVFIWNAFMVKRGWRDDDTEFVEADKKRSGLESREDIQTWFDFYDYDEKRKK